MSRLKPNRPGYDGYTCTGIPYTVIPPQDCTVNKYEQIPPALKGAVSNAPWENLSELNKDPILKGIPKSCNIDFDPFKGIFVDLHAAALRNGYTDITPVYCYEADGRFSEGYMNPHPFFATCACGSGG